MVKSIVVPAEGRADYEVEVSVSIDGPPVLRQSYKFTYRKIWPSADGIYEPALMNYSNLHKEDFVKLLKQYTAREHIAAIRKALSFL